MLQMEFIFLNKARLDGEQSKKAVSGFCLTLASESAFSLTVSLENDR